MSDTDVSAFLMELELTQLDQITQDLQVRAEQQKAEKRHKPSFPPVFTDLDSMAESAGLDLTGLMKDIKRRS
ncbi:hypothetical protein H9C73_10620 [Marinobacterium sp. AK62]|uniref:Uncharacterized protein n=1 Tax=Marinobacterium alkalitolerans TaxID=1542925 RepID=A0ABS3ZBV9_9GAMM|nr:hypothetical protein [Marinobacterium alkalitolerans]MBP0049191.1 hypothetical protein [Marinobacterium alkalitolerans]